MTDDAARDHRARPGFGRVRRARASRWLADYGADVVKVGPVPKHGGVQIVPPFHSYGGHRGMQRILVDLKADDRSRRVPAVWPPVPTW